MGRINSLRNRYDYRLTDRRVQDANGARVMPSGVLTWFDYRFAGGFYRSFNRHKKGYYVIGSNLY